MAFIGDTTKIKLQLQLTNFAESLPESKTRLRVQRISFMVTIVDDDADEQVVMDCHNMKEPPSAEYQQVLDWQAEPEDLQDDLRVRTALTQLSEKLCPYRNIATSLYDRVKSDDVVEQIDRVRHPLSSYRHISFRSAMLTRHAGAGDGHPELLFQHDGLGRGEQSCLRWRSHDYIKVTLCQPRPWFRIFWLIQWDIVDLQHHINVDVATGRRRRLELRPRDEHHERISFHGVRQGKRKSPWIAEVRPKGVRKKLWLGSYKSPEAAARAADVGNHYYRDSDCLNFPDSPQYLAPVPLGLTVKGKEEFVVQQAHRLVELTEMPRRGPTALQPGCTHASLGGTSTSDHGLQDLGLMWLKDSPVRIEEDSGLLLNSLWDENLTQSDWSDSSLGDTIGAKSDDNLFDRHWSSLFQGNIHDEM